MPATDPIGTQSTRPTEASANLVPGKEMYQRYVANLIIGLALLAVLLVIEVVRLGRTRS